MGLESSSARAEQMARQLLSRSTASCRHEELIERIDDVTAERVREFAGKLAAKHAVGRRCRQRARQSLQVRSVQRARA